MIRVSQVLITLLQGEIRMRNCGSLWQKQTAKTVMLSGYVDLGALGKINIMIFPNNKKEKDNQPDFFLAVNDENGKETPQEEKKSFLK